MRARPAGLAALLLAASLSGCLGFPFHMTPLHISIDLGGMSDSAHLGDMRVAPRYALLEGRAVARVEGTVRAEGLVDDATVDLWLVHGPCPATGPFGTPERYADHEQVRLGPLNGTAPFEATLSTYALPGEPMSVYADVDPDGLGPGFASCRGIAPTPPAAGLPVRLG